MYGNQQEQPLYQFEKGHLLVMSNAHRRNIAYGMPNASDPDSFVTRSAYSRNYQSNLILPLKGQKCKMNWKEQPRSFATTSYNRGKRTAELKTRKRHDLAHVEVELQESLGNKVQFNIQS